MGHLWMDLMSYVGLFLITPSYAFNTAVPAHYMKLKHAEHWESRAHDPPSPYAAWSRTPQHSASSMPMKGKYGVNSRYSYVKQLEAGVGDKGGKADPYYRPEDLAAYSAPWGISLRYGGTLNTYRIEAYREDGELAGYTTGFYVGDYLHLDKVQVRCSEKWETKLLQEGT